MTAPYYRNASVLFNEGEGLDIEDFNNIPRFLESQLWDQVVGYRARTAEVGTSGILNTGSYALGGVQAAPVQSATARTITNTRGVLIHSPSSVLFDGSDAYAHACFVDAGAMSKQLAVGDATNPRIDRIIYKITPVDDDAADNESRIAKDFTTGALSTASFVKRRKMAIDVQVVQGTPAGSPSAPSVTSGYVLWAEVYVPATHNAVIDIDNIRDYRIPIGWDEHTVMGSEAGAVWFGSGWSKLTTDPGLQSTGAATAYVFPNARACHGGRLMRLGLMGLFSGCTVQIVRKNFDNTGSSAGETLLQDISSSVNGGANQLYEVSSFTNPIWLNGFNAGVAAVSNPEAAPNDARMSKLAVKIVAPSSGKYLRFANFGVAAS